MTLRLLSLPSTAPEQRQVSKQQGGEQQVCVLFADLVGSTRLAARLPAGHYAALMTEAVQLMMLSLETRGAALLQHQGDAALSLWDAGEACSAALAGAALHERIGRLELARHLGLKLQLRVGLSLGPVILGELGGRPNAYGLPLNLARRLCSQAAPGETLACAATAQHSAALPWTARPLSALPGLNGERQTYRL